MKLVKENKVPTDDLIKVGIAIGAISINDVIQLKNLSEKEKLGLLAKKGLELDKLEVQIGQRHVLMSAGSSFLTELQLNKALQTVVKNSPGLVNRIKMLGIDMKDLMK